MPSEIERLEEEISTLKQKLSEARRLRPEEPVENYAFQGMNGTIRLSDLFGQKRDLLVVHNMGRSCPYCTLWADGLNGLLEHIGSRTAFAVASPDAPEVQSQFAGGRGWRFSMVSTLDSSFTKDLGYRTQDGEDYPGVSAFRLRDDGSIVRTNSTFFGPGDDFCPVWPLFDLLEGGDNGWQPGYRYSG